MRDPEFRQTYEGMKPEFDIARQLIRARRRVGLSQAEGGQENGNYAVDSGAPGEWLAAADRSQPAAVCRSNWV